MAPLKLPVLADAAAAWVPAGAARLRARPPPSGRSGAVRPGLTRAVPRPAGRHLGWFAADRAGPRSRAPPIRCPSCRINPCRPRGEEPTAL